MQFVRIREKPDQHNKLYFQCWVTTLSQEEPRRYGMHAEMISHAKTMTPYDASRSLTFPIRDGSIPSKKSLREPGSRIAELTLTPSRLDTSPASRVSWLCHSNDTAMDRQPSMREASTLESHRVQRWRASKRQHGLSRDRLAVWKGQEQGDLTHAKRGQVRREALRPYGVVVTCRQTGVNCIVVL